MLKLKISLRDGTDGLRRTLERKMIAKGRQIARSWVTVAEGENAPKAYVSGARNADIEVVESSDDGEKVRVTIAVTNAMKGSKFVDTGHRAYRLPEVYRWPTPKTRYTKAGRMYLIIPLPVKTSAIPPNVLRRARQMVRLGKRVRGSFLPKHLRGLTKGRTSAWIVFRIMRPDSPGWNIPKREGLHIIDKLRALLRSEGTMVIGGKV